MGAGLPNSQFEHPESDFFPEPQENEIFHIHPDDIPSILQSINTDDTHATVPECVVGGDEYPISNTQSEDTLSQDGSRIKEKIAFFKPEHNSMGSQSHLSDRKETSRNGFTANASDGKILESDMHLRHAQLEGVNIPLGEDSTDQPKRM